MTMKKPLLKRQGKGQAGDVLGHAKSVLRPAWLRMGSG